jgi:glycerol uptake facilitator protein
MSVTIVKNPNLFPAGVPLGIGFIGLAHGAAIIIGIASVARISGAHFNPAVTIGLAYSGRFPKNRVIPYIIAQLVGAAIAGFVQLAMVGIAAAQASDLGNTTPNSLLPSPVFSALLAEIVGTSILFITVLGSSDSSSSLPWSGSAIGLSLAAVIWALGGVSGASLNPARTFGPSIASLVFDPTVFNTFWIYLLGPIIGALLASEIYRRMR